MQQHYIEIHMKNGEIFYYVRTTPQQYANFISRYDVNASLPEIIGFRKTPDDPQTFTHIFRINEINFLSPVGMNVDRDGNGVYTVAFTQ